MDWAAITKATRAAFGQSVGVRVCARDRQARSNAFTPSTNEMRLRVGPLVKVRHSDLSGSACHPCAPRRSRTGWVPFAGVPPITPSRRGS